MAVAEPGEDRKWQPGKKESFPRRILKLTRENSYFFPHKEKEAAAGGGEGFKIFEILNLHLCSDN